MRICMLFALGLAATAADLSVVYTGRLIGYARACAEERFVRGKVMEGVQYYNRVCVGAEGGYGRALAAVLREAGAGAPRRLLLGVGDHFALDYRARSVVVDAKDGERAVGKDELFYHEPHGWIILSDADPAKFDAIVESQSGANTVIEGDATAQFLIDAGYDALAPGKHDFYFGAERLRQVSRLLARRPRPVQMLGTNLVIQGTLIDPPARVPEGFRKKNYLDRHADVTIGLPAIALPWLRRVSVAGKFESVVLCPVGRAGRDQACAVASEVVQLLPDGKRFKLPDDAPALKEVTSYHLCARRAGAEPVCTVFDVAQPLFQYGRENSSTPFPQPYFVDRDRNVVVMGVVAPGLEKQVGLLNMVWRDPKRSHEVRAVAVDAIQSIEQLLDFCEAKGDCTAERQMVLLAQMPMEAAAAVQRRTGKRFDLVIAEANPFTHTPFPKVEYPADYPALVVSPKPVYDANRPAEIALHAQAVILRGQNRSFTSFAVQTAPYALALEPGAETTKRVRLALDSLKRFPTGDPEDDFRQLVLETMRERAGAAVAILQKRDLFKMDLLLKKAVAGPRTEDDKLRAMVEGILWKGDFLAPRLVKGSALRRAMERAREFDALDKDVYFYESEYNRGLHILGAFQDPASRKFFVNGEPIADDKAYLVAMTDFLAFGDTGYPELAQELTGAPERPHELKVLPRISELVLDRLRGTTAARGKGTRFGTYMDYIDWPGFPVEPEATLAMQFGEYFRSSSNGTPQFPGLVNGATKNAETLVQTRSRWRVVLERGEVAWSDYWHNQTNQSALLRAFEGITESRVAAPETHSLNAAFAAELRREKIRSVDFLRAEGRLQNQRIENAESRFVHSYPQNELSVEAGWRRAMHRSIYQRPWWGWQVSGIVNTQIQNPLFAARVSHRTECPAGDCKTSQGFDASLGRTTRALVKLGARREMRDSWAEAGVFAGGVRRPESYQLLDLAPCRLSVENLRTCLDSPARVLSAAPKLDALTQHTVMGGGMESGVFANFSWRVPLTPANAAQLVLENRGRWYFNHGKDIPLDTRLSNLFSAGLAIPIAGRLALKPSWTLFHYLNKSGLVLAPGGFAQRPGVLLMGNTFDIKAEYRFDWTEGQSWLKVLRYGGGR